jgi:dinuclear metal center YbgI/SA1388 family protein
MIAGWSLPQLVSHYIHVTAENMSPSNLAEIVEHLDGFLSLRSIPDDPRAMNGLQVENSGTVSRIIAAVDVCQATIALATKRRGDFLLVHHGLFWGGTQPIAGIHGARVRALISAGIALYSAHIPLDCHPDVGNNHVLARRLGLVNLKPFGEFEGIKIGVAGDVTLERDELTDLISSKLGAAPRFIGTGARKVQRVGVVTGAGTSALQEAASAGVDTLLTGEGPHHSYLLAEELGINLILAGHYATETVGVQALAAHLGERFGLPWEFVDHPTGL